MKRSKPFLIWTDFAEELLRKVDRDIELPATFLYPARKGAAPARRRGRPLSRLAARRGLHARSRHREDKVRDAQCNRVAARWK